jgi:hypothetical protein
LSPSDVFVHSARLNGVAQASDVVEFHTRLTASEKVEAIGVEVVERPKRIPI